MHDVQMAVAPEPKQKPFVQSAAVAPCSWSAHFFPRPAQRVPPQSTSVSSPFCCVSVQFGTLHFPFTPHTLLWQSVPARQVSPSMQGLQAPPPQSTSVSAPSLMPSVQLADTHLPIVSQTVPPPSLQTVPFGWSIVPQTFVALP